MSSYIVSDAQINTIIAFHILTDDYLSKLPNFRHVEDQGRVFSSMLLAENYRAVNHRYKGEGEGDPTTTGFSIQHVDAAGDIALETVLGCINNLLYQYAEPDDWTSTKAYKFLNALKLKVLDRSFSDKKIPWGIDTFPVDLPRAA